LNLANIGSLGRTNAFLEATANSGRAAQPGFTETRKAEALKELLASVPEENKKVSRIDMEAVEFASKIYGHGRVKADGCGAWIMKGTHNKIDILGLYMSERCDALIRTGMRSSLYHYQLLGAAFMESQIPASSRVEGVKNH
jgi:hypothetical protein